MLRGISPYLSPDLLKTLCEMGHGDEILLADAHFPGLSFGRRVLRADGIAIPQMLEAILPLFVLDEHSDPVIMMRPDEGDSSNPSVEVDFLRVISRFTTIAVRPPLYLDRDSFYARAKVSCAVLMTGELRAYGNVILRKGVTPISINP